MRFSAEDVAEAIEDGDESVVLPDAEPVGGYAYELLYLYRRFRPPEHLVGDRVDRYVKWELEPMVQRLNELIEPTTGDYLAYKAAADAYRKYERFGMPGRGTWRDQSARWLHMIECVMTAHERADQELSREEAFGREEERRSASQG